MTKSMVLFLLIRLTRLIRAIRVIRGSFFFEGCERLLKKTPVVSQSISNERLCFLCASVFRPCFL